MKTLFNYLKKYKNKTFDEEPLNRIDILILTSLAYLNIESIIEHKSNYKFKEIYSLNNWKKLKKGAMVPFYDKRLIKSLSNSLRYDEAKINDYLLVDDKDDMIQLFSYSLTFDDKQILFLRGTNMTINGALEDLQFGMNKNIKAVSYFKTFIEESIKNTDKNIIISGHSKGGTIGELAFLELKEEYKNRIIKVYNLDGPGIKNEITLKDSDKEKLEKYITYRSVFGILLNTNYPYHIAKARYWSLLHHMIYSWKVIDKDLELSSYHSKKSLKRRKALDEYLNSVSDEELNKTVEDIKLIFKESKIFSVKDIKLMRIIKAIKVVFKVFLHKDRRKENMRFILACIKVFM